MARLCQICGRRNKSGNSRSHSNIASKRKFKINIQNKKIGGKKVRICAKCVKSSLKSKTS